MPDSGAQALLAVATFPALSGMPRDEVQNAWVFADGTPTTNAGDPIIADYLRAFYQTIHGYLSQELNLVQAYVVTYHIGGHLDGSPHGSPSPQYNLSLTNNGLTGAGSPLPAGVSVCLSFHSAYFGASQSGPADSGIPTDARARKEGAPATHAGRDRMASRHRGRIFLPPLNTTALDISGTAMKSTPSPGFVNQIITGATNLRSSSSAGSYAWSQWSRRDGDVRPVVGGFVQDAWTHQQRREQIASSRTSFAAG